MSRASTNVTTTTTTTSSSSRTGTSFFPRADAAILTFSTRPLALPLTRPKTIGPILDPANLDKPISCWSDDVEAKFYPSIVPCPSRGEKPHAPAPPPPPPATFNERYLRPFLADNERLRLSMPWYYTRDILEETEFLAGLQEKAHFAKEATGWEFVVIGILDINVYIRLATVDLELGILPRGETLCAHTITRPPGSVFLLPSLLEDWRFRTCPYLEKGGLYAYAGVPLRLQHESGNCVSLGSLCVASSKSEDPLTKDQQQALVRLGDWIVSDLVQCARSRRQRDRHRISELLSKAQLETEKLVSEEPIMSVLKTVYPNASITVQASKATHVELEGRRPLPISELESGLWEDIEYLDSLIAEYNHKPLPTTRTVRVIASPCESSSGSSYLIVATKDFRLVFDDIDSWFVQSCAGMISQMWRKRLLVEAIEAKERFLRGFSHQLRTPIHGILGSADLLAEELQRWNPAEYASTSATIARTTSSSSSMNSPEHSHSHSHSKYLNIIKMGGRDLVSIVNNMITLNRWADIAMTDRHYAMHDVDKLENELCTALLNHTAGDARFETSVFFTHDFPPGCEKFWMDIDVLRDSLVPLVSNAVQNSPHGIVSIHSSINLATKRLIVDIKDNGRGIPQNDQRRIFESYEKVDVHSAHAGLGLTLASRFAALLRGSVALISSTVGKGSHFRATFREVQYECTSSSSSSPQSLATKLQYLPSKFYNLTSTADKEALPSSLEPLLTCSGFVRSDVLEDCFVIFDVTSAEHYRERISQIPSGTVSICLIPGLEADPPFEPSDRNNIIFVSGPFSTTRLRPILEQADKLVWQLKSPETEVAVPDRRQRDVLERHAHEAKAKLEDQATQSTSASLAGVSLSQSNLNTPLLSARIVPSPLPCPLRTSSHPTALIVDDNMVNLRVIEMYCTKRGLRYKSAKDGLEAVEVFSQQSSSSSSTTTTPTTTIQPPIELIFMDLQMPVCNGVEATQRIRTLERNNNWTKTLILVMTGQDTVADKKAATEAGADGYFVKPVVVRQLDRVIKQYFPMFEYKPKSGLVIDKN